MHFCSALYIYCVLFCACLLINCVRISAQNCESKETCGRCIQEFGCFWCISPVQRNSSTHCLPKTLLSLCPEADVENPIKNVRIVTREKLSESRQISPQRVKIALRKNQKTDLKFQYMQSANYPIDLYYLMDLSHSMLPFKLKLAQLGQSLAEEMRKKTNNFKIGFGSFVDKLALPYVNTRPDKLREPCEGCASPYSFKNHLSLTSDDRQFSTKVGRTQMSGNLDTPEGGFDALMQAMVCNGEIGWRSNARHLLVMSTDAVSHIAGDGKLGGIVLPNDATCHMVNGTYTQGLEYDYPSISQINHVARQNNINIIFAIVAKDKIQDYLKVHYKDISDLIDNSKMGTLDKESNNVVQLISQIYDEIRDSVKMTSNTTKDVSVKIKSSCANFANGECYNIKPGQSLEFTATIEALECSDDASQNKKIIKIKPEGLEDSLVVELEVKCDCGCSAHTKRSSSECSGQGSLECGICRCDEGRFGQTCQCTSTESHGEDPALCVKPDGKNEICSGQGKCFCGKCQCKSRPDKSEMIYGKYCECDNFSCPLKCSGNGKCDCGVCVCDKGWTGSGCECSTDTTRCIEPGTKRVCSEHGECVCGQCQCLQDSERHSGRYCEECTTCPAQRCEELHPCVECQVFQTGIYSNETECASNCGNLTVSLADKLKEASLEGVKKCTVLVDSGCTVNFQYSYDDDMNIMVVAESKKSCPDPPNVLAWSLGVIVSVLLAGLIMLIVWKIVTTIHDKNEYVKFEKERQNMAWHASENPLYRGATSHFANPAYKRASQRESTKNNKSLTDMSRSEKGE